MSDDRLQMPEQLEKAFEYLKQVPTPTDFELAKQRALTWQQIEKRGRRFGWLDRWWRQAAGALTAVAVVVAALVVPHHLPGNGVEVQQGNLSAPDLKTDSNQVLAAQAAGKIRFYHLQGQTYLASDNRLNADLVEVSDPKKNYNELYIVKNGISHKVFEFSKGKNIEAGVLNDYLIGFQFYRLEGSQKTPIDNQVYLVNTELALKSKENLNAVKSAPLYSNTNLQLRLAVKQDNHLYVVYNISTDLNSEQVCRWDWDSEKIETLIQTTGQFVQDIQVYANSTLLIYQKQIVRVTDNNEPEVIDQISDGVLRTLQTTDDGSELLYSKGIIANSKYGSYQGDSQIMLYQASRHASVPLLPDVHGDQFLVGAPPDNQYLIENFVADDPVKAQQVPLTQVAGTLQLWYVKRDEQPKLVYSQKRTSEEMFVPLDSVLMTSSYPYPDPMNTTLLLYPYFDEETKTGLAFDWKTQTASEITVDEHAAKEKKITSNGGK